MNVSDCCTFSLSETAGLHGDASSHDAKLIMLLRDGKTLIPDQLKIKMIYNPFTYLKPVSTCLFLLSSITFS